MADLEHALRGLADEIAWPQGERLPARVAWQLRRRRRPLRVAAFAAAAVFALGGTAIGIGFALRGVEIVESPVPPATPAPLGSGLALGEPATLADARDALPFPVGVPTALGRPDGAFLDATIPDGRLTLVYGERPGLPDHGPTGVGALLDQFRARIDDEALVAKVVASDEADVVRVSVGEHPGFWIEDAHFVVFRDARGDVRDETVRLAANVLLWQAGDVTYRLEADVSRREAIRIARSVR